MQCKLVVLVTLGGCRLLDGLVVVSVEERKIVWCSKKVIVRGVVPSLAEQQRQL